MTRPKGFTLIELIIAVMIIGILAAVAVPVIQNMKQKAILADAITTLSRVRMAMREYYITNNRYPPMNGSPSTRPEYLTTLNLTRDDLDSTYFSMECYFFVSAVSNYVAMCYVSRPVATEPTTGYNSAPGANEAFAVFGGLGGRVSMDAKGTITTYNLPSSGYPNT